MSAFIKAALGVRFLAAGALASAAGAVVFAGAFFAVAMLDVPLGIVIEAVKTGFSTGTVDATVKKTAFLVVNGFFCFGLLLRGLS
ncbi:MAG: hypothetical protein KBG58_02820 [Giesbergeria sp.]|nr:hypothetical protein [Giesbergeria sp.]MBP8839570.1 hypothetical protein [Giesbergeria sp.]